ncbi:hypothetical protein Dimus_002500 [Dionaea muscipula]
MKKEMERRKVNQDRKIFLHENLPHHSQPPLPQFHSLFSEFSLPPFYRTSSSCSPKFLYQNLLLPSSHSLFPLPPSSRTLSSCSPKFLYENLSHHSQSPSLFPLPPSSGTPSLWSLLSKIRPIIHNPPPLTPLSPPTSHRAPPWYGRTNNIKRTPRLNSTHIYSNEHCGQGWSTPETRRHPQPDQIPAHSLPQQRRPSFPKVMKKFYSFTCELCADDAKPHDESFAIDGCGHTYCRDCVRSFVSSKLDVGVSQIGCPVPGCDGGLDPEYCRGVVSMEVFNRWGDLLCESVIGAGHKYYCPFKDCSALMVDDGEEVVTRSECPHCHRLFCAQCKVVWHEGVSCDEFQRLNDDERASEDLLLRNLAINNNWKRCAACKFYVEKIAGCHHMKYVELHFVTTAAGCMLIKPTITVQNVISRS